MVKNRLWPILRMRNKIQHIIRESLKLKYKMVKDEELINKISLVVLMCQQALSKGKSIYWCGSGSSAADAEHLAAELSTKCYYDRDPLPSEALCCNTSYLTAVANNYHYDVIYSRLISGIGKKGDILIGLSTSGKSNNVANAFNTAKHIGMKTIGFTGKDSNKFQYVCDLILNIPSTDTPRIQEGHMLVGHTICQLLEEKLFPKK